MQQIGEILATIEKQVDALPLQGKPMSLYDPILYSMQNGGKRIRPLLTILACQMFDSTKVNNAYAPAIAFEMFHNFTLLHDDLMDNAAVRRGKQSVPVKYGANTAILSGDTMLVEAFNILRQTESSNFKAILELFTKTAKEICEGQMYDMEFENRNNVTEAEYIEMIRLKTSVLIGACLKAGALVAETTSEKAQQIYDFGVAIGLAFQLRDDILDTFGNPETFGKKIGGDIIENKKTYLLINLLTKASADDLKIINEWLAKEQFVEEEKIAAIKSMYVKYGIDKMAQDKVEEFSKQAEAILNNFGSQGFKTEQLQEIRAKLLNRNK